MFNKQDNASKIAFVHLVQSLKKLDFKLIDCQVSSEHLSSLGAREIKREEFMQYLQKYLGPNSKTVFSV